MEGWIVAATLAGFVCGFLFCVYAEVVKDRTRKREGRCKECGQKL